MQDSCLLCLEEAFGNRGCMYKLNQLHKYTGRATSSGGGNDGNFLACGNLAIGRQILLD